MMRRWILVLFLLLTMPLSCHAAGEGAYIRLTMAYKGQPVPGGVIVLYDVSQYPEETSPEVLAEYVKNMSLLGQENEVNSEGIVIFEGLIPGRYLLVQREAAAGFRPIKPFCIRLSASAEGELINGIDASPKMEPDKLPQTGQIVWPALLLLGAGAILVGIGLRSRKKE